MEVLFDVMSAVERQSFCCVSIYCLSPVLPKLISPGPCPLTAGVACSVNKGLVLVRPLLYTQGWSDHSSLLSAIGRQKPGQCLPTQTCGTAFTNFNWFKLRWTLTNSKHINLIYSLAYQCERVKKWVYSVCIRSIKSNKYVFGNDEVRMSCTSNRKWMKSFTRHSTLLSQQFWYKCMR